MISLYAFFRYPNVFGFAGAMSPAFWFADRAIFPFVEGADWAEGRLYLDIGTAEGEDTIVDARRMGELLEAKGYRHGERLRYVEDHGAGHNERAWSARLRDVITYLLPVGAPA